MKNAVDRLELILDVTAKINLVKTRQNFNASKKALEEHTNLINSVLEKYDEKLEAATNTAQKIELQYTDFEKRIEEKHIEITGTINSEKIR